MTKNNPTTNGRVSVGGIRGRRAGEQIARCQTLDEAIDQVYAHYQQTRRKASELAEELFWLGASIAKAESLSQHGDAVFGQLSEETGASSYLLRRALAWYDLHRGDDEALRTWLKSHDDHLLSKDIRSIIQVNAGRIQKARADRRYAGQMQAAGLEPRLDPKKLPEIEEPRRGVVHGKGLYAKIKRGVRRIESGEEHITLDQIMLDDGRTAELCLILSDDGADESISPEASDV